MCNVTVSYYRKLSTFETSNHMQRHSVVFKKTFNFRNVEPCATSQCRIQENFQLSTLETSNHMQRHIVVFKKLSTFETSNHMQRHSVVFKKTFNFRNVEPYAKSQCRIQENFQLSKRRTICNVTVSYSRRLSTFNFRNVEPYETSQCRIQEDFQLSTFETLNHMQRHSVVFKKTFNFRNVEPYATSQCRIQENFNFISPTKIWILRGFGGLQLIYYSRCTAMYSCGSTVKPRFTNASDHEQFGLRTNFQNTKRLGWRTVSRVTNTQAVNIVER